MLLANAERHNLTGSGWFYHPDPMFSFANLWRETTTDIVLKWQLQKVTSPPFLNEQILDLSDDQKYDPVTM